ncbi:MAG: DKNYY domain-containing protein [Candidatus Gracilibacteria bacterium]
MKKSIGSLLCLALISTGILFAAGTSTTLPPSKTPVSAPPTNTTKKPIPGLIILGDYYAADEKNAYAINITRSAWILIRDADRETFKVIQGRFAQDKNHIYYRNTIIENVDVASFSVISGRYGYARDEKKVYGPYGVIAGADPETFKLLTGMYGVDSGSVYYDAKKIDADSATFEVLESGPYAVDAQKVFYNGHLLRGIPTEGFAVKGERAFASDGHVFFEGQVEKGAPLPEDGDTLPPPTTEPEVPVGDGETVVSPSFLEKLFSDTGVLALYVDAIRAEWVFLSFLSLVIIGIFSALFVFFADRNNETAIWGKVFLKTLIALVVGGAIFWLASYQFSLFWSAIIGTVIGIIAFLSLSNIGGKAKTFFVTLLSCIVLGFLFSILVMVLRVTDNTFQTVLTFLAKDILQVGVILGSIGVFFGSWLIRTQLNNHLSSSISGALIATFFSLLILGFVHWLGPILLLWSIVLFSVLFGAFLWVLSFRANHGLFVLSVRVLRIVIFLGLVIGLVSWLIF